ncbi:putative 26S proteasome regulatory subunit [Savitreella phatthalungensis]
MTMGIPLGPNSGHSMGDNDDDAMAIDMTGASMNGAPAGHSYGFTTGGMRASLQAAASADAEEARRQAEIWPTASLDVLQAERSRLENTISEAQASLHRAFHNHDGSLDESILMHTPLIDQEGYPRADIDVPGARVARGIITRRRNDLRLLGDFIERAVMEAWSVRRQAAAATTTAAVPPSHVSQQPPSRHRHQPAPPTQPTQPLTESASQRLQRAGLAPDTATPTPLTEQRDLPNGDDKLGWKALARVVSVVDGGAGWNAGMRAGDEILAFGGLSSSNSSGRPSSAGGEDSQSLQQIARVVQTHASRILYRSDGDDDGMDFGDSSVESDGIPCTLRRTDASARGDMPSAPAQRIIETVIYLSADAVRSGLPLLGAHLV